MPRITVSIRRSIIKLIEQLQARPSKSRTPVEIRAADSQHASHRRRHAQRRDRAPLRLRGLARQHHPSSNSGSAGQSFGAFLANGVTLSSKATPTITSAKASPADASSSTRRDSLTFLPEENILIGNVVLYGATSGEAFFNGIAGERLPFATPARQRSLKASAITAANT